MKTFKQHFSEATEHPDYLAIKYRGHNPSNYRHSVYKHFGNDVYRTVYYKEGTLATEDDDVWQKEEYPMNLDDHHTMMRDERNMFLSYQELTKDQFEEFAVLEIY